MNYHTVNSKVQLIFELSRVFYVKAKILWRHQVVFGCNYYIIDNRAADVNTRHVSKVISGLFASQHQATSLPFVLPFKETNKHITFTSLYTFNKASKTETLDLCQR